MLTAPRRQRPSPRLGCVGAGVALGLVVGVILGWALRPIVEPLLDPTLLPWRQTTAVDPAPPPPDDPSTTSSRAPSTPRPPAGSEETVLDGPEPALGAAPPQAPLEASASPFVPAPPGLLAGKRLVFPVPAVRTQTLDDSFADPRGTRQHEGIDIMAPRHSPVVAVDAGRIVKLFDSKPGGLTVYHFDPSDTYAYYYAHLQGYAPGLAQGDRVVAGQLLGYVGTTGNAASDAPHLHFAIYRLGAEKRWWEGVPLNPYDVLLAASGR